MDTYFKYVQLFYVVFCFATTLVIALQKNANELKALLLCSICAGCYICGDVLLIITDNALPVLVSTVMATIGGTFFFYLLCVSMLKFTSSKIPLKLINSISSIFFIFAILLFLSKANNTITISAVKSNSGNSLFNISSAYYYLSFIIFNIIVGILFGVLSIIFAKKNDISASILVPMIIVSVFPGLIKLFYFFEILNNKYNFTPLILIMCILIQFVMYSKFNYNSVFSSAIDGFFNEMKYPLIIVDKRLKLVQTNPSALADFTELKSQKQFTPLPESINDIFKLKSKQDYAYKNKIYEVNIGKVFNHSNNVIGYSALLVDVTENRKYVEELIETKQKADTANNAKTDFLANMSHEIRTPMNAITGFAELCLKEKNYTYANDIKAASKSLISIINEVLDISKIEAGKLELVNTPYDTMSLFNDVISIIFMQINKKTGIEFKIDIDENIPCEMIGDEVRIKQVMINLLNNAVKYTNEGFVCLCIKGINNNGKSTNLKIKVSDTGIGIKEKDIPLLFHNFEQLNTTRNRDVEGTGLGLSICKSITALMGGSITVESTYGKGTTFTVIINQVIKNNKKISQYKVNSLANYNDEIATTISASDAKVLVVDDNKVNLDVAVHLLNNYKIKPDIATSGKEAITLIDRNYYDLVFMDHMMPELDGIQTTQIIRSKDDGYSKELPIVALTANAISGAKEMFLSSGLNDFISKPIEIKELERILKKWLPPQLVKTVAVEQNTTSSNNSAFLLKGLDTTEGMKLYLNDKNAYISVLQTFANSGPESIKRIKKYLDEKDYKDYTIEVHGLKSASLSIGASDLSAKAKNLEIESMAGNFDYIDNNTSILLNDYSELIDNINKQFNVTKSEVKKKSGITKELFKDRITLISSSIDEMEPKEAIDNIDMLLEYSYNNKSIEETLINCRKYLDSYQYEEADKLLKTILDNI